MTYPVTIENHGLKPVWWTTDPAAAAAAAKVGVVYGAEPAKPAIEEPEAFGSVVRARTAQHEDQLWTPAPYLGEHYWMAETRNYEVWPELTDVEVLRVGLGDERPLQLVAEDAQLKGFVAGRYDAAAQIHYRLQTLLAEAITSERKNALEKAIQAVEELAP